MQSFIHLHKNSETEEIIQETHRLLTILGDTNHVTSPLIPALSTRRVGKRGFPFYFNLSFFFFF